MALLGAHPQVRSCVATTDNANAGRKVVAVCLEFEPRSAHGSARGKSVPERLAPLEGRVSAGVGAAAAAAAAGLLTPLLGSLPLVCLPSGTCGGVLPSSARLHAMRTAAGCCQTQATCDLLLQGLAVDDLKRCLQQVGISADAKQLHGSGLGPRGAVALVAEHWCVPQLPSPCRLPAVNIAAPLRLPPPCRYSACPAAWHTRCSTSWRARCG